MKVLLINIRYKYLGGPERYLFNLRDLLESKGHQVIPFAIKYDGSEPSAYDEYFVPPLSSDGAMYHRDQRRNLKSIYTTIERNVYSRGVEESLCRLIDEVKPDFAIALIYLRKLSPSVLVALNKKKIPFVVRLSDFGMICPNHILFRGNSICELCIHGDLINSVKYKCVHNSYAASMVNYLATKYHHSRNYFDLITGFISPSKFLIEKMIEAGWDSKRFHHVPTFAKISTDAPMIKRPGQVLYAGRLERTKGIHVLLDAIRILGTEHDFVVVLKLAGTGDGKYINELKEYCREHGLSTVEFLGELNKADLIGKFGESVLSVIPSLWYDNIPNSALESLACGTPIIGPNHGCFPELVVEGETGLLFDPGNAKDLALRMHDILKNSEQQATMSRKSIEFIQKNHSDELHYSLLLSVIEKVRSLKIV
jgi:glycosyltransferase involved in cell wall biosynthesis